MAGVSQLCVDRTVGRVQGFGIQLKVNEIVESLQTGSEQKTGLVARLCGLSHGKYISLYDLNT